LRRRGETVAVAESATGGLLGERLTVVPGSSDYFLGGFLTYTDEAKAALLGVDRDVLARETAVSAAVAEQMAAGTRERLGATYGLSITGVAGPDGGTEQTPAGTMFIGLAGPRGITAKRLQFAGDRSRIRLMSVVWALDLLRREMLSAA
jgi:nicotinamide-nucleotide amidase